MGIVTNDYLMTNKDAVCHELHRYISDIESGDNLKTEYSAGFYFRFLLQLKKFENEIYDVPLPFFLNENPEEKWHYVCKFYDRKFVLQLQNAPDEKSLDILTIESKMLNVTDFAKLYGVTDGAVRQWIRRGFIPGAVKYGNEWRIPELYDMHGAKRAENREYYWDSELSDVPEKYECFNAYDGLRISKTKDRGVFRLFFFRRYKKGHDNLELTVNTKEKEKIELWVIANPLVRTQASCIDILQ